SISAANSARLALASPKARMDGGAPASWVMVRHLRQPKGRVNVEGRRLRPGSLRSRNRLPGRVRDVATRGGGGGVPNGDRPPCQGESRGQRDRRDRITLAGGFALPAGVVVSSTLASNVVRTTGGPSPPLATTAPRPRLLCARGWRDRPR